MRAHGIYLALIVLSWNIYSAVKQLKKKATIIAYKYDHLKRNTMFRFFLDNEGNV